MEDDQKDDKPFQPTKRKLDRLRADGKYIKSDDLQGAISLLFTIVAIYFSSTVLTDSFFEFSVVLYADTPYGNFSAIKFNIMYFIFSLCAVLFVPGLGVVTWLVVSGSFGFSSTRIHFNLKKLSVFENAKKKFSISFFGGMFKRILWISIVGIVVFWFVLGHGYLSPYGAYSLGGRVEWIPFFVAFSLLVQLSVSFIAIGFFDFMWQRFSFIKNNRMSGKEVRDEQKESDGDPWQKGERRRRALLLSQRALQKNVSSADVVIVNPNHYAVALKWDRDLGGAPICVEKGMNDVALLIKKIAVSSGVPIRSDPPTARILYKVLKVGDEVPRDNYRAVAAAIRFSDEMKKKIKKNDIATYI